MTYRIFFVQPWQYLRELLAPGWYVIGPIEERDESKVFIRGPFGSYLDAAMSQDGAV